MLLYPLPVCFTFQVGTGATTPSDISSVKPQIPESIELLNITLVFTPINPAVPVSVGRVEIKLCRIPTGETVYIFAFHSFQVRVYVFVFHSFHGK